MHNYRVEFLSAFSMHSLVNVFANLLNVDDIDSSAGLNILLTIFELATDRVLLLQTLIAHFLSESGVENCSFFLSVLENKIVQEGFNGFNKNEMTLLEVVAKKMLPDEYYAKFLSVLGAYASSKNNNHYLNVRLSNYTASVLLSFFSSYGAISSIFNPSSDIYNLVTLEGDYHDELESKNVVLVTYVSHNMPGILSSSATSLCVFTTVDGDIFVSFPSLSQHCLFELNDKRLFFSVFDKSDLFKNDLLTWEHVRLWSMQKPTYDKEQWRLQDHGNLKIYSDSIDQIYVSRIRPRLFESFKRLLESVPQKNIRIFELGAGKGDAGIMCADYASNAGYSVSLYSSDIHEENMLSVKAKVSQKSYPVFTHIVTTDTLSEYLSDMNADSDDNTACILISSGCLCFGIIPGDIVYDLQLVHMMHRYGIDYVIADGLESPIINRTVAHDMYQAIEFRDFSAPFCSAINAPRSPLQGKHYGLVLQKNDMRSSFTVQNIGYQRYCDLSFDPNPLLSLRRLITGEIPLTKINFEFSYFQFSSSEKIQFFKALAELSSKNGGLEIVLDQESYNVLTSGMGVFYQQFIGDVKFSVTSGQSSRCFEKLTMCQAVEHDAKLMKQASNEHSLFASANAEDSETYIRPLVLDNKECLTR